MELSAASRALRTRDGTPVSCSVSLFKCDVQHLFQKNFFRLTFPSADQSKRLMKQNRLMIKMLSSQKRL